MEEQFYCLGIKAFGLCSYNPAKPNSVYFSIGEAVAAIALVLAFYQLLKPEFEFKLRVKNKTNTVARVCFLIAIISVLIAAILPSIPGEALPFIGYPIFWELLAGILIVIAAALLFYIYSSKAIFDKRNYKRFFNQCYSVIARGNDDAVRALADNMRFSAPNVIAASCEYDSSSAKAAKKAGKEYTVPEHVEYALALLKLFSDRKLCRSIVDSTPGTAMEFIEQIIKHDSYDCGGYSFVQQIIKQAFISEESMLHREEEYYGLGHFQSFTKTVFGNYTFVKSKYSPLDACEFWKDDYHRRDIIEKYSKAVQTSLTAYFEYGDFDEYPSALLCAVNKLADIAFHMIVKLKNTPQYILYRSEPYEALSEVGDALTELLQITNKYQNKIPEYKFDEASYDYSNDPSIYGVLA